MDWIHLIMDGDQWWSLVTFGFSKMLSSFATGDFSRRAYTPRTYKFHYHIHKSTSSHPIYNGFQHYPFTNTSVSQLVFLI
jgi:hypothetical protein